MEKQTILIKGMVCNRCVMTVKDELQRLGHSTIQASLGEASFVASAVSDQEELGKRLMMLGFGLLEDDKTKMVKAVKALVEEVYSGNFDFPERFRFSNLVKERLRKGYDAVSDVFVAMEKRTIEQYLIAYRINKVKEFLVYTSLTLSDIAFRLNFNSAAHLSAQFRQQTGLTTSFFKGIKKQREEVISSGAGSNF